MVSSVTDPKNGDMLDTMAPDRKLALAGFLGASAGMALYLGLFGPAGLIYWGWSQILPAVVVAIALDAFRRWLQKRRPSDGMPEASSLIDRMLGTEIHSWLRAKSGTGLVVAAAVIVVEDVVLSLWFAPDAVASALLVAPIPAGITWAWIAGVKAPRARAAIFGALAGLLLGAVSLAISGRLLYPEDSTIRLAGIAAGAIKWATYGAVAGFVLDRGEHRSALLATSLALAGCVLLNAAVLSVLWPAATGQLVEPAAALGMESPMIAGWVVGLLVQGQADLLLARRRAAALTPAG